MKIVLTRKWLTNKSTIGEMYVNGDFECYTLEDPVTKEKVAGKSAIPAGTYKVIIDWSVRFRKMMPHILNVPQFAGVRIHAGNTPNDTEGCLLLGKVRGNDCISESRRAVELFTIKLMDAVKASEEVTLEIK